VRTWAVDVPAKPGLLNTGRRTERRRWVLNILVVIQRLRKIKTSGRRPQALGQCEHTQNSGTRHNARQRTGQSITHT